MIEIKIVTESFCRVRRVQNEAVCCSVTPWLVVLDLLLKRWTWMNQMCSLASGRNHRKRIQDSYIYPRLEIRLRLVFNGVYSISFM